MVSDLRTDFTPIFWGLLTKSKRVARVVAFGGKSRLVKVVVHNARMTTPPTHAGWAAPRLPLAGGSFGSGGGFGAVFKAGSSNASRFGERAFTATPSSRLGKKNGGALHNPDAPDALVLRPAPDPDDPSGLPAIVMDPFLAAKLRPHQVEGVKFLYNALMGVKDASGAPNGLGRGSLLADDMGLGKTLQTIAIIYTMLSQPSFRTFRLLQ